MKVFKSKKDYYCRAYNKQTKTVKLIHGATASDARFNAMAYMRRFSETKNITFKEAFDEMIDGRTTLSPTTVRSYDSHMRNHLGELADIKLTKIDTKTVQRVVDKLTARLAPKTVHNAYGVVTSVLSFHDVTTRLKVKLPIIPPKKKKLPSMSQIRGLIDGCKNKELKTVLELAIYGGLRRGETCALLGEDITKQNGKYIVSVNKAYGQSIHGKWVLKSPKSLQGYRDIEIPEAIAVKLPKRGRVVNCTPSAITMKYIKYTKKIGFKFNMHILRHWSATYMKHKGCSDEEVMQRFGWSSLDMLKVYVDIIDDMAQSSTAVANMMEDLK